mgnify:FL=1|tara:strand:- start:49 stop:309 length:261 start_codon:yes stop_codon:yes gene_type:complete
MKILIIMAFFSSNMLFSTIQDGESLTLPKGVQFVSIACLDCDVVHGENTIKITSSFTFPDYPQDSYNEIIINAHSETKIAYRYENY